MVAVFSKDFNVSKETERELTIASKNNIPILTFKVSDTVMSDSKEYFLANLNWIDAFPNPENYFGKLKESIEKLIGKPKREYLVDEEIRKRQEVKNVQQVGGGQDGLRRELEDVGKKRKVEVKKQPQPPVPKRREWVKRYIWVIAILLLLVALAVMLIKGGKSTPEPVAPVETLQQSSAEPSQDDQVISVLSSLNTKQGQEAPAQQSSSKMCVRQEKENLFFIVNGVEFKMVKVEGGTLSDYYIGETEVTQGLWKAVMGEEPTGNVGWRNEYGRGAEYPAYRVSYNDITEKFIPKLNKLTGREFRLPQNVEWVFAFRGGKKSKGYKYSGSNNIDEVAWYCGNSKYRSHPVRGKKANELGLYDMSGNVYEWCNDWIDEVTDLKMYKGSYRVVCGGSWLTDTGACRVDQIGSDSPSDRRDNFGFRLVMCP